MIPPSTTITPSGRRLRTTLLWLAAGVVALNVIVWVASSLSGGGAVSGPGGSSFVTTSSGTAALAGTLNRLGVEVRRSRLPLDERAMDGDATVVIVDVDGADYSSSELNALEAHLLAGGRLVVAGHTTMVERLLDPPPRWRSDGAATASTGGGVGAPAGAVVALSGFGSLEPAEPDTTVLATGDGTVVAVSRPVGAGTFVWVADSFPFRNEGIGQHDSAVVLAALLDPTGPVVFDEYRHGYRQEGGLWSLLPAGWQLALLLGAVVALVGLIAYGRRLGPPHDRQRRLPPGRELFLEAVAGMLARSASTAEALEAIRREARRRLEERAPHTDPASAAVAVGLEADEIEAVLGTGADDDTLVTADRALATLNRENR